jgi:hypothetical protein
MIYFTAACGQGGRGHTGASSNLKPRLLKKGPCAPLVQSIYTNMDRIRDKYGSFEDKHFSRFLVENRST